MTYVLVTSDRGVNGLAAVYDTEGEIVEKLRRWLPELRNGRVSLQDFGYKKGVVSENGNRSYEIFKAANRS